MLSIENPPPDLPEISHLKSSDDEKIKSSSDNLALPEKDVLKSGLDDNNNYPLPKFSIRDYVFNARSKDITTNWPFSEKNLQLCLKHGVKDLLPPFQPLDSVRNQSVKRCAVYDNLLDQDNLSNLDGEPSRQSEQRLPVPSERVHISSSGSDQGDKDFPSSVDQSHTDIDSGADTLSEPSTKQVEAAILPETRNTDRTIQSPVKKCRLIVKLSTLAGPSTKENIVPNNFMASETLMASKVCPVCKTFSSSSNTTLNAHIDQCLSGESTAMKWTEDPKVVIKHRIKPRKMRSMVDIYETALHCTLEDLDRRNGTSWATNSTLPDQETELLVEDRVQRVLNVAPADTGKEGAVYIDSNGRKVGILSKFTVESKLGDDVGPQKGEKRSKFLSAKKKKHHKLLKLAAHGNSDSPNPSPSFETRGGQGRNLAIEQSGEKEVQCGQHFEAKEQMKLDDDSGIIRRWVCSKRTSRTRKTTNQVARQHSGHNLKDLLCESDPSSLTNSYMEKSSPSKIPDASNILISSPQRSKRMETLSYESHLRKREEFPFLDSRGKGKGQGKRFMVVSKHNRNYGAVSLGNKEIEINAGPTKTLDAFGVNSKPSCSNQAFLSKATKFSSTRKKLLCKIQASVPKSSSDGKRKRSVSQIDDDDQPMEETTDKISVSRPRFLKIRKKSSIDISKKEEAAVALKSSHLEPHYYGHGVGENLDFSSVKVGRALEDTSDSEKSIREKSDTSDSEKSASEEVVAHGERIAIEPAVGRSFLGSSNSLDSEFNELPSPSAQPESEQCAEVNHGHLYGPEGPVFPNDICMLNKQDMFSADEFGDAHMGAELDSNDRQGNYFSEVDPIPIPGPPGSFLPSPGHMGSDDLQGHSSLTNSRVQSADDHHDPVTRDLSDSPISAASTISNPKIARSESRSSEKFSVEAIAVQDDDGREHFSSAGDVSVVENFIPVSQAAHLGAERLNLDGFRSNAILPEKAPVSYKNEQLCCCSRKEGASHGVALNIQESQLLRRRTMATIPFPKKQMDCDSRKRLSNLNSRSEMLSLGNFPDSGPEKVVHPPMERTLMKVSAYSEVKFPIHGDHDLASPSAPTPVLRLMGKNLMVVNMEEDTTSQQRHHQSSSINARPNLQSSAVFPGSVGNENYHSFHQMVPQGPIIFNQDPRDEIGKHFDARLSNNIRSHEDLKAASTGPFRAPGVRFPSMSTGPQLWNVNSTSKPIKEIINIDDVPENESMGRIRVSSSGDSVPWASNYYSSRPVNPFYTNRLDGGSLYGGPPVMHNASFQMPISDGVNPSPVKWSCNPEGSSVLHRPSSLGVPSSSAGHPRPTFYHPPRFS